MIDMKPGDLVRHKNYHRAKLRVKRINESVATCERIQEKTFQNMKGDEVYPVYVIAVENLELIAESSNEQLKMF